MNVNEIFSYMGKQIRVLGDTENPLFCLKDVCDILELRVDMITSRMRDDPNSTGVISKNILTDNIGRKQQMYFVNEDGLYDVILDSRKPIAKKFRKWITSEVLPNIRKYGTYINIRHETIRDVVKLHNIYLRSSLFQLANYINKYYQEHKNEIKFYSEATTFTKQILTSIDEGCGITVGERDKADTEKLRYLLSAELEALKIISDGFYYNEKPDKILDSLNNLRFKFENLRNGNDFERSDFID